MTTKHEVIEKELTHSENVDLACTCGWAYKDVQPIFVPAIVERHTIYNQKEEK